MEFDVERSGADAAPIHGTQDLDVADRIETEPPGDSRLHELDDARHRCLRLVRGYEVEVGLRVRRTEIWD
jgi:hypothetical protein